MSFFTLFKTQRHDFSDSDRELATKVKQQNAELRKLELEIRKEELQNQKIKNRLLAQQEINDLRSQMSFNNDDEEENNPLDNLAAGLLNKLMMGNTVADNSNHPQTLDKPATVSLSSEQIQEIINQLPKSALKIAKKMDNEQIRIFIRNRYPDIDEESINKGITMLKDD